MLVKKRTRNDNNHLLMERVANRIASVMLSIQLRFAVFMDSKTSSMSTKAKWLWLLVFCLVSGGFSIYALLGTFKQHQNSMKPSQLSVPKYYDRMASKTNGQPVSEKDIEKINAFKKYLDSMRLSSKGKIWYDSILRTRPGLIDSIRAIEEIYYSQSK